LPPKILRARQASIAWFGELPLEGSVASSILITGGFGKKYKLFDPLAGIEHHITFDRTAWNEGLPERDAGLATDC